MYGEGHGNAFLLELNGRGVPGHRGDDLAGGEGLLQGGHIVGVGPDARSLFPHQGRHLLEVRLRRYLAEVDVIIMAFAARDALAGQLSVGDFVLANTLLIQLFMPLNFLGVVYREIKQGLVDIEQMSNRVWLISNRCSP